MQQRTHANQTDQETPGGANDAREYAEWNSSGESCGGSSVITAKVNFNRTLHSNPRNFRTNRRESFVQRSHSLLGHDRDGVLEEPTCALQTSDVHLLTVRSVQAAQVSRPEAEQIFGNVLELCRSINATRVRLQMFTALGPETHSLEL